MVNLRDVSAVIGLLREERYETAAKIVEAALKELIQTRFPKGETPDQPRLAPPPVVLH